VIDIVIVILNAIIRIGKKEIIWIKKSGAEGDIEDNEVNKEQYGKTNGMGIIFLD